MLIKKIAGLAIGVTAFIGLSAVASAEPSDPGQFGGLECQNYASCGNGQLVGSQSKTELTSLPDLSQSFHAGLLAVQNTQ